MLRSDTLHKVIIEQLSPYKIIPSQFESKSGKSIKK